LSSMRNWNMAMQTAHVHMVMDIDSPATLQNQGRPGLRRSHPRIVFPASRDTFNAIDPKPSIHLGGRSLTSLDGRLQESTRLALFFRAQTHCRCANTCHSPIPPQSKAADWLVSGVFCEDECRLVHVNLHDTRLPFNRHNGVTWTRSPLPFTNYTAVEGR
jgi:hypothetical protein